MTNKEEEEKTTMKIGIVMVLATAMATIAMVASASATATTSKSLPTSFCYIALSTSLPGTVNVLLGYNTKQHNVIQCNMILYYIIPYHTMNTSNTKTFDIIYIICTY